MVAIWIRCVAFVVRGQVSVEDENGEREGYGVA